MKQLALILSIVAVILGGVSMYLHINENKAIKQVMSPASNPASGAGPFRIAYFDMDSLQNNYQYFKDVSGSLKSKEDNMNAELANLEKTYQKKIAEWQQKGNTMSQAETETANREYQQMQQNYALRKQQLEQNLVEVMNSSKKQIRDKVEAYLKEYNKTRNFAYIFSDFPDVIFYKDTIYNITGELIQGLNSAYKK